MKKRVVILGGGVGGLSAGWMLARTGAFDVTVVERAAEVGGMCRTFSYQGLLLDHGPHKCYSAVPEILEELQNLLGDELIRHEKRHRIRLFGRYLHYPVRLTELLAAMPASDLLGCAGSLPPLLFQKMIRRNGQEESYADYVRNRFGPALYRIIFEPLAEKTWGTPESLSADIAKTRLPSRGAWEVLAQALRLKGRKDTDAPFFYYPRTGFGRIPSRMAEEIVRYGGKILTDSTPTRIESDGEKIAAVHVTTGGTLRRLETDLLISTLPFDTALQLLDEPDDQKAQLLEAARCLEYRAVFLIYVVLNEDRATDSHWIFFPEREILFGRVFEQKNMSPEMIPHGKTVLCCDFTAPDGGELWHTPDEPLIERCLADLEKVGLIERPRVLSTFVKRFPRFYPRYDLHYQETLSSLYRSLAQYKNFLSTGRIGFYNYNNSDHCLDMGRFIAEHLVSGTAIPAIWEGLEQRVGQYRIID